MSEPSRQEPPDFTSEFREQFENLLQWRRDVRQFRRDPIEPDLIQHLLELANLAPSVGLSQPWRFVEVTSPAARRAVRESFTRCNREALEAYQGERAQLYATLKLAGLDAAPVQFAVYCDEATDQGHGLGRKTMPEMLRYSVVTAIHTLWLAARAWGLGLGWVSILDPEEISRALEVPEDWTLVAYLCLGLPEQDSDRPELDRAGWEERQDELENLLR